MASRRSKVVSAEEAVARIRSGATVTVDSCGGGINEPGHVLEALERRFLETGEPRDLTLYLVSGIGDRRGGGADRFAHEGMVGKVFCSHWGWAPNLGAMAVDNRFAAYVLPQGCSPISCATSRQASRGRWAGRRWTMPPEPPPRLGPVVGDRLCRGWRGLRLDRSGLCRRRPRLHGSGGVDLKWRIPWQRQHPIRLGVGPEIRKLACEANHGGAGRRGRAGDGRVASNDPHALRSWLLDHDRRLRKRRVVCTTPTNCGRRSWRLVGQDRSDRRTSSWADRSTERPGHSGQSSR
jgi:hypothetical protein